MGSFCATESKISHIKEAIGGFFFSYFTQENEAVFALLYSRLIYTSYKILKVWGLFWDFFPLLIYTFNIIKSENTGRKFLVVKEARS